MMRTLCGTRSDISISRSLKNILIVVASSLFLGVFSSLSIPLPFSPIPLALAPHLCLALALILGKKRATLAVLMYLAQGVVGLPVFALGASGVMHLFSPSGGYLLGYLAATYLTGAILERKNSLENRSLALVCGNLLIYAFGACQLSFFIGIEKALLLGVVPFLLGDTLKTLCLLKLPSRLSVDI